MKRAALLLFAVVLFCSPPAQANLLDKLQEYGDRTLSKQSEPDSDTISAGLKQALTIGAKNGVAAVSRTDGYFGNQLIRIPMPENMQKIEKMMRRFGFHKEVDEFVLTMNRAAEKAAPQALDYFIKAVREMTIPDAVQILHGNDTAATGYLKSKTYNPIYASFKPIVSGAMNDVGVTRAFKQFMDKAETIPFLKRETVDLDAYVTGKALDGLFVVVGQEEQKIRKNPEARVTDLLKKVFQ